MIQVGRISKRGTVWQLTQLYFSSACYIRGSRVVELTLTPGSCQPKAGAARGVSNRRTLCRRESSENTAELSVFEKVHIKLIGILFNWKNACLLGVIIEHQLKNVNVLGSAM